MKSRLLTLRSEKPFCIDHSLCGHEKVMCESPAMEDGNGYICTREAGHKGYHVACVRSSGNEKNHNLVCWK
jgi:hypothetical protein